MDSLKRIHRILILFLFLLIICVSSFAQKYYHVLFYNVENLFDPFNDPFTSDDAYTPSGINHWTRKRFDQKTQMIYKTIISSCHGNFPDIIGLAEIENRWVLEQLISTTPLKQISYGIIHKDSPDSRGIDVSLLYRKDRINPSDIDFMKVSKGGENGFKSRDILYFKCKAEGINIHFFVNHWPSRSEGYLESKEKRAIAARVLRTKIDFLYQKEKNPNILIMGDFNATPGEETLLKILKASPTDKNDNSTLINLSSRIWKKGEGTIYRRGQWEIFDQFICSKNMLQNNNMTIQSNSTKICFIPFLLEKDQNYLKKKPFRTYLGPIYHGGVSDHLPIVMALQKN